MCAKRVLGVVPPQRVAQLQPVHIKCNYHSGGFPGWGGVLPLYCPLRQTAWPQLAAPIRRLERLSTSGTRRKEQLSLAIECTWSSCLAATGSTYPEIGPTIHFRYTANGATFSADGVLSTDGAYQLGKETLVAVQLMGPDAAECLPTSKLGDARPLIGSLVGWRLSHCPPLHSF